MSEKPPQAIDLATCHEYVAQNIFRLRPSHYTEEYPKWPGMIGLELEMLPFITSSLSTERPKLAPIHGEHGSLAATLLPLSRKYGWQDTLFAETTGPSYDRLLSINTHEQGMISFEPGGQLEVSTKPFPCLVDALGSLKASQKKLRSALANDGISLLQLGINPWQTVDEIGLQMSKPRYRAMDSYFTRISPYGRRMMRQTCTIQVNLDFGGTEQELAQRYVAANLIAPFTTAIFAYSPIVNRAVSGAKSARGEAWRYIDPSRTGVVPLDEICQQWTKASCVETYLDFLLDAPVVFVSGAGYQNPPAEFTFRKWLSTPYQGISPSLADFETHVSLHFPEVRPRGFLELRSVDAQSAVWQSVPALFYTSLLYDAANLQSVLSRLIPRRNELQQLLVDSCRYGLDQPMIREESQFLMDLCCAGIERLPNCFLGDKTLETVIAFNERFTSQGRSPADDLLDVCEKNQGRNLLPTNIAQLEDCWRELIK